MENKIVINGITYIREDKLDLSEWKMPPSNDDLKYKVGDYIEYTFTRDIDLAFLLNEPLDETRIGRINRIINNSYIIDDKLQISSSHIIRKLKPSQIESHLIKEAKRRGYKEGVKVKCLHDWHIRSGDGIVCSSNFGYVHEDDELWICGHKVNGTLYGYNYCIYQKGQWAEIIKEEPIKIGDYEIVVDKNIVKVGCKDFLLEDLILVRDLIDLMHRKNIDISIQSGTLYLTAAGGRAEHGKIDYGDIDKIIEKLQD